MKNLHRCHVLLVCAAGMAVSAPARATEYANVISKTAIIEQIAVPSQTCSTRDVAVAPERGIGGSVIGAVAGGLLGSTVGGGNGRIASAAIGAATGAVVGDRVENADAAPVIRQVQQCQTVTAYEPRTVGYQVVYEYAGKQYSARLNRDPGASVPLRIAPEPDLMLAQPAPITQPYVVDRPRRYRPAY